MAWSTRQIAELAGVSLRAVRHYHEVGLLAEPERRANGYKQYGVAHLVRLLRIKRLSDLGFSLAQIAAMGDVEHHPEEALRTLDAELAATIERLQRARAELGLILRQSLPADLPPEFAPAARTEISDADRSLFTVMTRVLGPAPRQAWADVMRNQSHDPVSKEFDTLPADADEHTRQDIAERMAPSTRKMFDEYPDLRAPEADAPHGEAFAKETMGKALRDLYNPAQLDVLQRLNALLATGSDGEPARPPETPGESNRSQSQRREPQGSCQLPAAGHQLVCRDGRGRPSGPGSGFAPRASYAGADPPTSQVVRKPPRGWIRPDSSARQSHST
ncbi:MerR family transcriptional regulator [Streptomyces bathyalis]|uniref:MerR family transcriptional regulator n=1 Tax=Streptomyces bathyalis TaxID=2710756 RepID=A0A7T1T693_9ACTN|nr:MerR family transcriptional regulator [Streptomyces bathyalis]QPP07117.1 MerR family transcriptional regulator [Streptomyces bathyalis]